MELRIEILRLLASPGESRFRDSYLPARIAQHTGRPRDEVWEVLWGLLADGLIFLDPAGQPASDNWRWRLSAVGQKVAAGGAWEPRDPQGYLRRLRERIPDLDPVAFRYVEEALRTFNARSYLASSVMLGVAAEQVFTQLAWSIVAWSGVDSTKLKKALENPRSSHHARFVEMRACIEPIRGTLPDDLGDRLTLDTVADLLRITRNEAGHPTGREVDEETGFTHLAMAGRFLAKMTDLRRHFEMLALGAEQPSSHTGDSAY